MYLDPSKWKKASDLPIEKIPVPQWGGELLHRPLSGEELTEVLKVAQAEGKHDITAYNCELIARALVEEAGKRLYTPSLGFAIKEWPSAVFALVIKEIQRANGQDGTPEKNSDAGGSAPSSGLPSEPARPTL